MSNEENENVYFLKGVADELSGENKKLNESTSQLTVLMDRFNKELADFKKEAHEKQGEFQNDVLKRLEGASSQLAKSAYDAFTEKSLEESNGSIKSLKDLSFKISKQIGEATKKTKFCFKKLAAFVISGSIVGGLVGGIMGGVIMRYFPKLDDYVEERYTWGRALERSWKDLTKSEQDKIQKLLSKNGR